MSICLPMNSGMTSRRKTKTLRKSQKFTTTVVRSLLYLRLHMAIHHTHLRLAPAGKSLAQHFHSSKQTGSSCMRMLHRHTSILVNGLKKLDQRQAETEKFIELQKRFVNLDTDVQICWLYPRFNMRTIEYQDLNLEAHLNDVGLRIVRTRLF